MATQIRNTVPGLSDIVAAHNDLKAGMLAQHRLAQADVAALNTHDSLSGSFVDLGAHNDQSEVTVGAANATDLPSSLVLINNILDVYAFHMADTLAHKVAGVALASYSHVSNLADAITRANDVKSKYNTHCASTTYHYTADSTNSVSASNASDQGTLNTLLNQIKTELNAHLGSGPAGKSLRLVDA